MQIPGYEFKAEEIDEVYQQFLELADRKKDISDGDLEVLCTFTATWQEPFSIELPGIIETPDDDHRAVLIKKK